MPELLQMAEVFLLQDPLAGVAVAVILLGARGEFVHCGSR